MRKPKSESEAWLEARAPGFQDLPKDDRRAIFDFAFLWSLFEAEIMEAAVQSSSINAQHRMIASGLGLGVLPRFIGTADPSIRQILPELGFTRSFWIVTHRDTRQLQRVTAFKSWLREVVARHRSVLVGEMG